MVIWNLEEFSYTGMIFFCRSSDWLFLSSQANMNHLFRRQLEEIERDNSGFLILKRCPDDLNNVYKRCKGSETYQYPEILQVSFHFY